MSKGGRGVGYKGCQHPFPVEHIRCTHSSSKNLWAITAAFTWRHSCTPAMTLLCTFLGYSTMIVFRVPLSKRCTRARTMGRYSCPSRCASMIGYNIMVSVEILTRCSYETLTAKFVQVVKIRLFTVVSNSYAKITFLPKRPLLTYVLPCQHQSIHPNSSTRS